MGFLHDTSHEKLNFYFFHLYVQKDMLKTQHQYVHRKLDFEASVHQLLMLPISSYVATSAWIPNQLKSITFPSSQKNIESIENDELTKLAITLSVDVRLLELDSLMQHHVDCHRSTLCSFSFFFLLLYLI